ncbi:MAG: hypothetical protein MZU95_14970 [Desulfomicrobium escambiense]|nr:hypothetical protein [Desulfomicrobium escambiense]
MPGEADVMLRDHGVRPPHAEVHDTRHGHRRDHSRGRGGDPGPPEVRQGSRADDHGLGRCQPAPAFSVTTYDGIPLTSGVARREAAPPLLLVHGLPAVREDLTAPRGTRPDVRGEGLPHRGPERGPRARDPHDRRGPGRVREEERLDVHARAHGTPEAQQAYGTVSVFPTLFFVDRKGTVGEAASSTSRRRRPLEEAIQAAMQ